MGTAGYQVPNTRVVGVWGLFILLALLAMSLTPGRVFAQAACSWGFDSVNRLPPWIHKTFPTAAGACSYQDFIACNSTGEQCGGRVYSPGDLLVGTATQHDRLYACDETLTTYGSAAYCSFIPGTCKTTFSKAGGLNVGEVTTSTCPQFHVTADVPNAETRCPNCQGDPINPEVGSVFRSEDDVIFSGPPGSVRFRRYYNSAATLQVDNVAKWHHSYDARVQVISRPVALYPGQSARVSAQYATASDACTQGFLGIRASVPAWANATASLTASGVCQLSTSAGVIGTVTVYADSNSVSGSSASEYELIRDDGQVVRFPVVSGSVTSLPGVALRLTVTSSGYTVIDEQDTVEQYDSNGSLQTITNRDGVVQTLSYDTTGRLTGVSDSFGHGLTFSYYSWGGMSAVSATNGGSLQYIYDHSLAVSKVTYPDASVIDHQYTDSNHLGSLTGLVDETGTLTSTWSYDSQNRAITSSEAGGANGQPHL